MNSKQIIQEFRLAIAEIKEVGRKTIRISALEHFLAHIEAEIDSNGEISKNNLDARLVEFNAENERNIAQYNAEASSNLEMFRSVITAGQSALKSALIINGGAAVAMLAFIGNLATKGTEFKSTITVFSSPLLYFTLGVLCASIGFGGTYLSQVFFARKKYEKLGSAVRIIVISVVIASYGLFLTGAISAKTGFVEKEIPNQSTHSITGSAGSE